MFPRSECCTLFPPIPTFRISAYPGASPAPPLPRAGVLIPLPPPPPVGGPRHHPLGAGGQLINEGQRVGKGDRQVTEGVTSPCLSRHRSPLEGVTPATGPADRPVRMLPREVLPRAGVRVTGACVKPETPSLTPALQNRVFGWGRGGGCREPGFLTHTGTILAPMGPRVFPILRLYFGVPSTPGSQPRLSLPFLGPAVPQPWLFTPGRTSSWWKGSQHSEPCSAPQRAHQGGREGPFHGQSPEKGRSDLAGTRGS